MTRRLALAALHVADHACDLAYAAIWHTRRIVGNRLRHLELRRPPSDREWDQFLADLEAHRG